MFVFFLGWAQSFSKFGELGCHLGAFVTKMLDGLVIFLCIKPLAKFDFHHPVVQIL
jgi:hypothetical protein